MTLSGWLKTKNLNKCCICRIYSQSDPAHADSRNASQSAPSKKILKEPQTRTPAQSLKAPENLRSCSAARAWAPNEARLAHFWGPSPQVSASISWELQASKNSWTSSGHGVAHLCMQLLLLNTLRVLGRHCAGVQHILYTCELRDHHALHHDSAKNDH